MEFVCHSWKISCGKAGQRKQNRCCSFTGARVYNIANSQSQNLHIGDWWTIRDASEAARRRRLCQSLLFVLSSKPHFEREKSQLSMTTQTGTASRCVPTYRWFCLHGFRPPECLLSTARCRIFHWCHRTCHTAASRHDEKKNRCVFIKWITAGFGGLHHAIMHALGPSDVGECWLFMV